ncbi:MAG: S41 family peptidase [Clostridiales bacterium]|nr:S41 family peptidase [Clostridiales bacterium]
MLRAQSDMVTISRAEYERLQQYAKLDEVKQYIDKYYYQPVDSQALLDGAIQGLLSGTGDAYTFYYPEEAWKTLWEEDEGKYAGIGVQMLGDYDSSAVTIIRVFKNTPAEAAGLRKGDVFYKVEELEVTTATMQDAVNLMRGVPGEKVHVEIVRDGTVMPFDIIKAVILVNRIESIMLPDDIGYIALYEFAGGSYEDFKAAFDDLTGRGMKALIVDLRDNGGGWVEDGVRLADLFLDKALLYYTEDRTKHQEKAYVTDGKSDIPLVLLINEHSASTTEIVSGALKDYDRATLVGTESFGKGIIQDMRWLSDGKTGFQYTVAEYFSPKGNRVHKEGVMPNVEVEMPEDLRSKYFQLGDMADPQLKAAYDEAVKLAAKTK